MRDSLVNHDCFPAAVTNSCIVARRDPCKGAICATSSFSRWMFWFWFKFKVIGLMVGAGGGVIALPAGGVALAAGDAAGGAGVYASASIRILSAGRYTIRKPSLWELIGSAHTPSSPQRQLRRPHNALEDSTFAGRWPTRRNCCKDGLRSPIYRRFLPANAGSHDTRVTMNA
jgi:hypothetical protein